MQTPPINHIIHGDSQEILRSLPSDSVDLICTDPPYGYSFMGKSWDKALPSVEIWKECLRVLKPGAFAFIMSAPRSDVLSRMIVRIEDAGFRVDFTPIYWTYASGFPKAMNIGKMVDKKPLRNLALQMRDRLNAYRIKANLTTKQVNEHFGFATTGSGVAHHWMTHPTQPTVPTQTQYKQLKTLLAISDPALDALYIEAERAITGKDKNWGNAGSTPLTGYKEFDRKDNAQSPQAKALDGSYGGFQPKPAVEVIIVAMKPLSEKTYVDQALKNGKGITWLDDGRIPTGDSYHYDRKGGSEWQGRASLSVEQPADSDTRGRFPANLLIEDDVLNDGRILGGGKPTTSFHKPSKNTSMSGDNLGHTTQSVIGDSGSYSRYFSLDAWSKTLPFLTVAKGK